ncbi:MAG: cytochrome c biogenesis protein CcsA [Campylobacterota bacterium]|nr:cytochrome c biogenesis protein CcsA [Campylobacterota bacterium]
MLKHILSMKMAVLVLFIFGIVVGAATFIENDYGTQTAQALIYKAQWFEVFLAYFIAILVYNIIKYKSYKSKPAVFLFHFSFVVIALGAIITRYIGYEGIMHIREGKSTNLMVSDIKLLQVAATNADRSDSLEKALFFSSVTKNSLNETLNVGDKEVNIELLRYLPTAHEKVVQDPNGKKFLELKISTGQEGSIYYFSKGDVKDFGDFYVSYEAKSKSDKATFIIKEEEGKLKVDFPYQLKYLNMDDKSSAELNAGLNAFKQRLLYQFGDNAIVLKDIHEKGRFIIDSHDLKTQSGKPEFIELKVQVGDKSKIVVAKPYKGQTGELNSFILNGVKIDLRVGAKIIELPFSIKLEKFKLERYPGSMTPASYASDVVLIDEEQNINMPYAIYMNHVLDHRNYRFFQSSYDMDEKGTILSVNHDPGTWPTYIGYILLTLGMIWSLFIPNGRFQKLLQGARKLQSGAAVAVMFSLMLLSPLSVDAATPKIDEKIEKSIMAYDLEHAKQFGKLAVQDNQGRMKPIDTIAHDIIAKVTGKGSLFGLKPTQLLLGMMTQPSLYQEVPMIKIGHPKIAVNIGLPKETKFAKFSDFFLAKDSSYKLYEDIVSASRKKPLEKTQYDKKILDIDERVNVSYMAYQGSILRIFPKSNDANNKWFAPMDAMKTFPSEEAQRVKIAISAYFLMITEALKTGDWKNANLALVGLHKYQKAYGAAVLPSQTHIEMEIQYNKLGIFGKLVPLYLILGLILFVFSFINIIKPKFSLKWIMRGSLSLLFFGFIIHVVGMGMRWYVAGHAPWSNAYESIVFIAAATIFAGLVLARRSPFALAGAAILAGVTMAVAHMSFINPEITNLVPVLKSYWLMIHVATIISGNGFFGLGSILSLMVLILFIVRGSNGHANIDRSIKELTNLSEMSLIIGLFLYTVGNFLGGVWANESWGRYWGWDAKETWAAVTILIYAVVLHLRFVPSLKSSFVYNVASTWAYSTVLMTYFGVNYYLSGLHSYAAGDPVPMPMWVYYSVAGLFVLTALAARNRKLK